MFGKRENETLWRWINMGLRKLEHGDIASEVNCNVHFSALLSTLFIITLKWLAEF
jgi:hypothetical protein